VVEPGDDGDGIYRQRQVCLFVYVFALFSFPSDNSRAQAGRQRKKYESYIITRTQAAIHTPHPTRLTAHRSAHSAQRSAVQQPTTTIPRTSHSQNKPPFFPAPAHRLMLNLSVASLFVTWGSSEENRGRIKARKCLHRTTKD